MFCRRFCQFFIGILTLVISLGTDLNAQGEIDTMSVLPEIEINSLKVRSIGVGSQEQSWSGKGKEALLINNLAELLSIETGSFIKSYGLGSLATSSIRGGSASHMLILWNGLPIQNPMLGQVDLALLPVMNMESISFTRGGNTSLWGSGAIGGILRLDNEVSFTKKMNLDSRTAIGSFGLFSQQMKVAVGNTKFQSVTQVSHHNATNDYYYFLAEGFPERQQSNANYLHNTFMEDIYWKLNDKHQIEFHFWGQGTDRQIPPTNVQLRSLANQKDQSTRMILQLKKGTENGIWKLKMGLFDERLNYYDRQILLTSESRFRTTLTEITGQLNLTEKHQIFIGSLYSHTQAQSTGYLDELPTENKMAVFTSWKYHSDKLSTQISLRQAIIDGILVPSVPSLGIDYALSDDLVLKSKISRNYHLPTLNDRYWRPGGNPELIPESGWSQEMSIEYNTEKDNLKVSTSITAFNRNINNWILWSIIDGQSFWSANNLTEVWSRGLEPRLSLSYSFDKVKLHIKGGYNYIRSTNQVSLDNPKIGKGEQLIYTPIHQGFANLTFQWKDLNVSYQHRFVGNAEGINDAIEKYQVANASIHYSTTLAMVKGEIFFKANNIWNIDYLAVERRPMPGIQFQFGLNLIFNKFKKA